MNQEQYLHALDTILLLFAQRDFQANYVFQDDNATAHRARRVLCDGITQAGLQKM